MMATLPHMSCLMTHHVRISLVQRRIYALILPTARCEVVPAMCTGSTHVQWHMSYRPHLFIGYVSLEIIPSLLISLGRYTRIATYPAQKLWSIVTHPYIPSSRYMATTLYEFNKLHQHSQASSSGLPKLYCLGLLQVNTTITSWLPDAEYSSVVTLPLAQLRTSCVE